MKEIQGGVCAPAGFTAAGVHCGIRANKSKKDLGLLLADTKFDLSRTYVLRAAEESLEHVNQLFREMAAQGGQALDREGIPAAMRRCEYFIDMRYQRQNFEICIPVSSGEMTPETLAQAIADFHREHKRSYGYYNKAAVVQMVNYRVSVIGMIEKPEIPQKPLEPEVPMPEPQEIRQVLFQGGKVAVPVPVYSRFALKPGQTATGPCILEQMDTTVVVPVQWTVHVDGYENLLLRYKEG